MQTNSLNTDQVKKTLRAVTKIFNQSKVDYRFMGSIIPTAMNSKLYRRVNDFDVLIGKSKLSLLLREFDKAGFKRKSKNFFRISEQLNLYIFKHPSLLETGFFAVDFKDKPVSYRAGFFKFLINEKAIKKTQYSLFGIKFWGIPPSVAYLLSSYSEDNPKRKTEFQTYEKNKIMPFSGRPYDAYFLTFKVNWLIDFLNWTLVVFGKIRMSLGKTYDPWR